MADEVVQFDVIGPVARLTLNRPQAMNAINLALLAALDRALGDIAARDDLRAVVITGAGPAFCVGADLKEVLAGQNLPAGELDFLDRAAAVFNALRALSKPTIAALNGMTMAGGLELAMACDLIIAAESAQLADAHANYGVYPGGGGAAVLPRRIPLNMAMYLLYTGKALTAAEMKAHGLVCEVHPDDKLVDAALALAAKIAEKSPVALRKMKEVARASADKTEHDALLHEQVMLREHLRSADMQEGLRAFAEKRKPKFAGH